MPVSPLSATPSRAPAAAALALALGLAAGGLFALAHYADREIGAIEDYAWVWWLIALNLTMWALALCLLALAGVVRRLRRRRHVPPLTYPLLVADAAVLAVLAALNPFWGTALPAGMLR